jgi:hypothetical protein
MKLVDKLVDETSRQNESTKQVDKKSRRIESTKRRFGQNFRATVEAFFELLRLDRLGNPTRRLNDLSTARAVNRVTR